MTAPVVHPQAFPDAELVAVTWLRAQLPNGTTVDVTKGALPAVLVTRVGGLPVHRGVLDRARIVVDVWAGTKKQARDLAATAQAALWRLPEASDVAEVTRVEDELGLTWLPDDFATPATPRYQFGVAVYLRATRPA